MVDKLLLVIINYNEPESTANLVKTIANFNCAHYIEKILILNNGEKKVELNDLPSIGITIESEIIENHGFGAAINIGIQKAINLEVDFLWSLNVDVEISESTLEELMKVVKVDRIVGSVIHDKFRNGYIYQYGTNGLDTWRGYRKVEPSNENELIVDAVAGTSMVIGREVFTNIRFDEEYFMYVEENDYCYTAKQNGYNSYVCKNSVVVHESGGSFNNKSIRWYYKVRNLLKFKKKTKKSLNVILIIYLMLITIKNYRFEIAYFKNYCKAVIDYKKNKYGKYV